MFFSRLGATKLDLINYYMAVEEPFLAAVGGRATLMQRFPDGASGKNLFQERAPKGPRSGSRPPTSRRQMALPATPSFSQTSLMWSGR